MTDKEFKAWEKEIDTIKAENDILLDEFAIWLRGKNLKSKTINSHTSNVSFYINDYLLRYDIIKAKDGAPSIGMFLGDFFIRKASWASKYTIKENIASMKKFYSFMCETGKTPQEDLAEMIEIIKDESEDWITQVERYWDNL